MDRRLLHPPVVDAVSAGGAVRHQFPGRRFPPAGVHPGGQHGSRWVPIRVHAQPGARQ
ncbi:MAG: hypothetical protein ACKVKP_00565 [Acidimicrobiales bacterium]